MSFGSFGYRVIDWIRRLPTLWEMAHAGQELTVDSDADSRPSTPRYDLGLWHEASQIVTSLRRFPHVEFLDLGTQSRPQSTA